MSALISPSKGEKSWAFPLLYLIQLLISMAPPFMCTIWNGCQLPLKTELDASMPAAVGDAKPSQGQEGSWPGFLKNGNPRTLHHSSQKGCGPPGTSQNNGDIVGSCLVDALCYLWVTLNLLLAVKKCVLDLAIYCLRPACWNSAYVVSTCMGLCGWSYVLHIL